MMKKQQNKYKSSRPYIKRFALFNHQNDIDAVQLFRDWNPPLFKKTYEPKLAQIDICFSHPNILFHSQQPSKTLRKRTFVRQSNAKAKVDSANMNKMNNNTMSCTRPNFFDQNLKLKYERKVNTRGQGRQSKTAKAAFRFQEKDQLQIKKSAFRCGQSQMGYRTSKTAQLQQNRKMMKQKIAVQGGKQKYMIMEMNPIESKLLWYIEMEKKYRMLNN